MMFPSCFFELSDFYLDVQILNHPQENLIINCCERVTLSVSAVGPGQLSYQWKKDGLDVRDPNCSGIKESKLIIPSFRHKDQGHYKCEIKDDHNKAIESNTAELKLSKNSTVTVLSCL